MHAPFQTPSWLPEAQCPQIPFKDDNITQSEVEMTVKQSRNKASPSPVDQTGYIVFKKCPALLPALLDLFQACWSEKSVPSMWSFGVMKLIPKLQNTPNKSIY